MLAPVKLPIDVIPGASVPSIISTPFDFNFPDPVKFILLSVVHEFVACLHKNSLSPFKILQ